MPLLRPRFNYTPIKRTNVDGRRLYTTPGGHQVPSVTTVLGATKPEKAKKALLEWQKNVGQERAQAITTQAANRGTRMHTLLENYIETGSLPERSNNPFSWASHAMAQQIIQNGLSNVDEAWGMEVPLYMPEMYAGTTDLVGVHSGAEAIMDHKQSNRPKTSERVDDYRLQCCAYAAAHNEVYGTRIRKAVIFVAIKPATDRDGLLQLVEDKPVWSQESYQEFVIEGADFDYWSDQWWKRLEQYYLQL